MENASFHVNVVQVFAGLLLLLYATVSAQMTAEQNAGQYVCRWCKRHYASPIKKMTKGDHPHLAPSCPRCGKFV